MPRKPGSDGSDTALFDMLRNKLFGGSKSKPVSRPARGATAAIKQPAPKAPAAKAPSRTTSSSVRSYSASPMRSSSSASTSSMPAPRRMTAAERQANAARKEPVTPKRTPKVTVQEAPPARPPKPKPYPGRSGNMDEESFGKAFAHYRKAGNKVFTWRGKSYTTKLKEEV